MKLRIFKGVQSIPGPFSAKAKPVGPFSPQARATGLFSKKKAPKRLKA